MKLDKLLISNLNISEDHYNYKGLFTISGDGKSMNVDLTEMENEAKIDEIKNLFNLSETIEDIKNSIMAKVIEQSGQISPIKEGKEYDKEKTDIKIDKCAKSMDMA